MGQPFFKKGGAGLAACMAGGTNAAAAVLVRASDGASVPTFECWPRRSLIFRVVHVTNV
jgi:hypothetical protein